MGSGRDLGLPGCGGGAASGSPSRRSWEAWGLGGITARVGHPSPGLNYLRGHSPEVTGARLVEAGGGGGAASGLLPAGSSLPAFRQRAPFRPPSGRGGGAGALPGRFPAREGRGRARRLAELGGGRNSARGRRVRPVGSDAAKPGPRGCARALGGAGPRQPRGNGTETGLGGGDPASGFRGEDPREAYFLGCFCRTCA